MGKLIALPLLLLCISLVAVSQPQFPPLSGRVVDQAQMLSAEQQALLSQRLAEHENSTSNQIVVVTLTSLNAYEISDYGYQLGRHWQIGQAGKDNGVLLIVAKSERKVRIEVGYGLEGALTDALSRRIIDRDIVPFFKSGNFAEGIIRGTEAILAAIQGEYTVEPDSVYDTEKEDLVGQLTPVVFIGFVAGQALIGRNRRRKGSKDVLELSQLLPKMGVSALIAGVAYFIAGSLIASAVVFVISLVLFSLKGGSGGSGGGRRHSGSSSRGRSSSRSGGFSGGGGGFGGGGASGSW